jgi:pimeloyl-ACP methyl ester carboxylesterase
LRECGHVPHREQQHVVLRLVSDFIEKHLAP